MQHRSNTICVDLCCVLLKYCSLYGGDVVKTVTFETETSINLRDRDRDFIKNSETRYLKIETETSKFVDFAKIFQKILSSLLS